MKRSLVRVATPESAQKILFRLINDGKITDQDIDKESPSSALLRETAAKYYPEIKLKPHRNLLRDTEPVEAVQASADPRDFDPGSQSQIHPESTQVLGSENEAIHPQVSDDNNQEIGLFEPVPF